MYKKKEISSSKNDDTNGSKKPEIWAYVSEKDGNIYFKYSNGKIRLTKYRGQGSSFTQFDYPLCVIYDPNIKKYGVMNRQGQIVVPIEYDFINDLEFGRPHKFGKMEKLDLCIKITAS
ncbi:MAG: hypothetical protein IPN76_20935 [Saprospiraceae bacterium]|nr:hypothetical protein [Saprospiraceae bacterium]